MDIFGHPFGISTDVKVGAFLQPFPELGSLLLHTVLDVDLFRLIPGEGGGEFVEMAGFLGGGKFVAIKKVCGGMLVAKKEPVSAGMSVFLSMLEEGPEGGDPGAGTHHDDVAVRWREMEMAGWLHIDRERVFLGQSGQIAGGQALFGAAMGGVLDQSDGQMNMAVLVVGGRGDGVEAWGDFIQKMGNLCRVDLDSRSILQDVYDVPIEDVFVELLFIGTDGLQFVAGRARGLFRHGFDEFLSGAVENEGGGDGFLEGGVPYEAKFFEELLHEAGGIAWNDPEGVPADVGGTAGAQLNRNMSGVFRGPLLIEEAVFF